MSETKATRNIQTPSMLDHRRFVVKPGSRVRLKDHDPDYFGPFKDKKEAETALLEDVDALADAQELLFANDTYSILIVFQAMDAAGKDGAIKHVMSGVNPQGCQVASFKQPSSEELDHNYLWRYSKALPERGRIGIFNRSYYEEVLVVRVHPKILAAQRIPKSAKGATVWRQRFEEIRNFEEHLHRSGTEIIKFFLHISKEEQRQRFLDRLNDSDKLWKFSAGDVVERGFWNDYMKAYEEMLGATSTEFAPWYVIPANKKRFARACVADIIASRIRKLGLKYPEVSPEKKKELDGVRLALEAETGKRTRRA
jgi:PPK2 family polyphosphate:nucleotide phosphotransferase